MKTLQANPERKEESLLEPRRESGSLPAIKSVPILYPWIS